MEKQTLQKIKKVGGVLLNVLLWLFVAFSVVVTVITVSANANKKNVPVLGGKCYLSVQSDSMNAEKPDWTTDDDVKGFKKGDLIFGKYIAENEEEISNLKVGDVITFEWDITNDGVIAPGEFNTHRIKEIKEEDGVRYFITQGDNFDYTRGMTETVYAQNVVAKYTGKKMGGVGAMLDFLGSSLGFGLCIILPLALFFIYELVVFIKAFLKIKNEGKIMISAEDEELIKRRAVEEYLRQQREKENCNNQGDKKQEPLCENNGELNEITQKTTDENTSSDNK